MKKTIYILAAASLIYGAGCSKSKDESASSAPAGQNTTLPVNSTSPVATQSAAQEQPTATATTTTPAVTAGLNPAHGQPGHRCDIQVGAPLNSPAGVTVNPGAAGTPAATATARPSGLPPAPVLPMNPPVATAKGMNPPHGQPGHDCSIAVGAPLKK